MHLERRWERCACCEREWKYLSSGVYDVRADLSGRPDGISDVCILLLPSDAKTHGADRKMADNIILVDETEVYEEMRPFISMIKKQHMDILNHAQMRQEFTANVSHELKTPLTAISDMRN